MKTISRRRFIASSLATVAAAAAGCTATPARNPIRYRLGLSQPADSPNAIRLQEMAEKVRAETSGAMQIEVYPASKLGSDNVMIEAVRKGELELYLGGNVFGPLVPVTEMPGLPFTFKNSAEVFTALDADMGEYIRGEMLGKGMRMFRLGFDNGFHQITCRTKPIRSADDLAGLKIRTPFQKMTVDFFQTLGAQPSTYTLNQLYQVLKEQKTDAQTDPLGIVVLLKLYEVQTYLSLTNHWWSGFSLVANPQAWGALPRDVQDIVDRHADAAALAQRRDIDALNSGALEFLRGKGMIVNEADTSGFRKPLREFYGRWKQVYGDKAWALLEARVGKLV
jgi:TRAP-type transport system periplasmic protein